MKPCSFLSLVTLMMCVISACSSPDDIEVSITSAPPPTPTQDMIVFTRQAAQNAQRVCLDILQSNSEVEPNFTQAFSEYIQYFLTQFNKDIIPTGDSCDLTLKIDLNVEPIGGKYQGADDLCYTGANITGEITLAFLMGETLIYPVQWEDPITEGAISRCPTKQDALFYLAYQGPMLPILSDLWGVPVYVYAFIKTIEFKPIGSDAGGPRIECNNGDLCYDAEDMIRAYGSDAVPELIILLSNEDDAIRYGAVSLLSLFVDQAHEAIPLLIELLDDPFVIVASLEGYDDLYPVRAAAKFLLVDITGQDWGYEKDQWYQALGITPISGTTPDGADSPIEPTPSGD